MKELYLVRRYDPNNVDQDFMDLEFDRLDAEARREEQWITEELTRMVLQK